MEIIFKSPSGKTGRIPANNKEAIIELLQKGYNLDDDPTFKSPSGKTGRIPANNKEAIIELLQKGYNFEPTKKTPKVKEKGFLDSLADEPKMLTATVGRSLDDFTNLPANLLQMGYAGFKKGIDNLGNNAELGANPELGISADDISRAQQSDSNYNPFSKENALGQIARIPNTIFNKTAEGIGSLTGMEDNKYYNDDRAYEENLENANPVKKFIHGTAYYAAPGALTRLPFQGLANAAKFGAVSTGIQQATGANPIVADIITALDPIGKAKTIGKVARSPIENIIYPLAKRKVGDIDVGAVEASTKLFGNNTYSLDNFRTGEGLDSLSSNLAHIGSKGYKNQQANSLNAFNSKLDEIGQNIGGTSQELKEVYTPLYESVKEAAQNTPPQRLFDVVEFLKNVKEKNKTSNSEGTTRGEIIKNVDRNLEGEFGLLDKETFKKNKEAIEKALSRPKEIEKILRPKHEEIIANYNKNLDLTTQKSKELEIRTQKDFFENYKKQAEELEVKQKLATEESKRLELEKIKNSKKIEKLKKDKENIFFRIETRKLDKAKKEVKAKIRKPNPEIEKIELEKQKKIDDKIQKQIKELEVKQKLATEESKRLEIEQNENIKKIISTNNETKNFKEKGITEFENLLKKLNTQQKNTTKNKLKTEDYDYPDYYFDNNYVQSPIDYEVSALPRKVSPSEAIIMRQNNNEDLRGFYKNKPYIQDPTIYSNYLQDFNKNLDEALKKMLPQKVYEDLSEANKKFGQGQKRDLFEKLLDPTFDYAGNRLKIDKTARMLNTPKDIKALKALAKEEDHPKLDDLAKISQRVYKTNARNAGRTGSGQTRTGEEVAYEAAKAAIETAITGKTPTGIVPLVTRYTYGKVMGDLMISPKFRDYMIRVSKNPKDTKAKLALDAMIQKKTGLTTKQLSTILARDSVNKLTIDKNEESGQ